MGGPGTLLITVFIVVVLVLVWTAAQRLRRRPRNPTTPAIDAVLRTARLKAVVAVLLSMVAGAVMIAIDSAQPQLLGLSSAVAPGVAGIIGISIYAAFPPRTVEVSDATPRMASLTRRTAWSYVSKAAVFGPVTLAAGITVFLIFTGMTARADERGRYRQIGFETEAQASAAGPYPGWFYGIPLIIVTVVLLGATVLAYWRLSSTPVFPLPHLKPLDARWRRVSTRVVASLSIAGLLLQFGGVSVSAGTAITRATFRPGVHLAWDIAGFSFLVVGAGMLIGSILSLALAGLWSLNLVREVQQYQVSATTSGQNVSG